MSDLTSAPKFKKISDKKYQRINTDGEWVSVDVPYAKVERLFVEFVNNNGMINVETGQVQTDILTLVSSFGKIGDILLTEYGPDGSVTKDGNSKMLGIDELFPLYRIGIECIESFIRAVSETVGAPKAPAETAETADVKEKAPRKPKP